MNKLAIKDLYKIKFYLDGFDPSIFISFSYQLDEVINSLRYQPYMYAKFKVRHNKEYRRIVIRNYIIVYDVIEDVKEVHIDRVFHKLEDYTKNL